MSDRAVVLEMSRLEGAHLADLVSQLSELLSDANTERPQEDPALARLVPDAYRDDAGASSEFRSLTQGDLLGRRAADASVVRASLALDGVPLSVAGLGADAATTTMTVHLDGTETAAWMRTLTALRLVLASRLGIEHERDHDPEDPRFGVFDWLGFRLEGLLRALDD